MAEYYPLLAKAVGSLPNSTPETRRVVYERARKALIGQLRTLHPPVPEDDIERESVELDRAIQRLERELASGGIPPLAPKVAPSPKPAPAPISPPRPPARPASVLPEASGDPERKPLAPRPKMPARKKPAAEPSEPVRTAPVPEPVGSATAGALEPVAKVPAPSGALEPGAPPSAVPDVVTAPDVPAVRTPAGISTVAAASMAAGAPVSPGPSIGDGPIRPRVDMQRPIAPQPRTGDGSRRRTWIVLAGIAVIVAAVAAAAYKLRDTRQTVVQTKAVPEQVAQGDSGKISERVGGPASSGGTTGGGTTGGATSRGASPSGTASPAGEEAAAPAAKPAATGDTAATAPTPPPANPEVPVAHRAALLIEAPEEPNKVKTFLGTVVWKLDNVNEGPGDGVGLAVEADIDLPDDKMKASVVFEKNTDASLPASHTIKIRFTMQPGSATGDIRQISVPQLRQEDNPSGEALAGVTVPVVQNSFLVGLSPGNAETVNIKQLKDMQWIDVPILLASGKIAKLTFEKGTSGERDINEAVAAWQKS